ncbi:MAG: DinB family protein [Nocardioidaceae bacterium]
MTDQPPPPTRLDPPYVAEERQMFDAWLDYHRETLLWKCHGLTGEQLKIRSAPPSTLSLLGLVRHMAEVERGWFRDFAGDDTTEIYCTEDEPEADFDAVENADAAADLATLRAETAACRALVAGHDLDESQTDSRGRTISLRWIYIHMIEEYARHNGHADLLRELIDGATGD